jgi:TRAP-type C4-dicarboxylate transport system substrate-binding protein
MKALKLSLAAIALATAGIAQATEFRSSDIHPDDYPTVLAVRHMGETLSKATNGKHSIKVYAKSALGQEKDTIEQTKLGALAMTRVNVAPMNNICPATMVPTMPFLFRSTDHSGACSMARSATRSSRAARPRASSAWPSTTPARARSTR